MTNAAILLVILGAVAIAAGLAWFVGNLTGAWRGRNSDNLEYGVVPAMAIGFGLIVLEGAAGWPGWPFWVYFVVPVVLAFAFCGAILRARARGRTDL